MAQQLLSSDPNAAQPVASGQLLSSDPAAGIPQGQLVAPTANVTDLPDAGDPSRTLIVHVGDKAILIPKVIAGPNGPQMLDDRQAVARWQQTGEHFGVYSNAEAARAFGLQLHSATQQQPSPVGTGPLGQVPTMLNGASDLGSGFMQAQPIHPLATGQAINDYIGKTVGLPMYDAYQAAKKGQSVIPAMKEAAGAAIDPILQIGLAQGQLAEDAKEAFKQGNVTVGAQKAAEYLLPFFGPLGGAMTDTAAKGQIMNALGQALGISTNLLPLANSQTLASAVNGLPTDSPQLGRTAAGPVMPPDRQPFLQSEVDQPNFRMRPNGPLPRGVQIAPGNQPIAGVNTAPGGAPQMTPQVAQQVSQWADAQQPPVPLPVGVRTGNRVASSLQEGNARSSLAAAAVENQKQAQFAGAMKQAGDRMANQIAPNVTPELHAAGSTGRDILADLAAKYRVHASDAYDMFRQGEQDPKHTTTVSQVQMGRVRGDAPRPFPVPTQMQLPVDLSAAQKQLRPIFDRLSKQWPEARKASSPAYAALKNVVEGPSVMPASEVDANLSGLKSIARQQGGVAKAAVGAVEDALQKTLGSRAPDLQDVLDEGRTSVKAQKAVEQVVDRLKDEKQDPYTALRIDDIENLKRNAPDAVPIVARGWLQKMMNRAFEEDGRFDHAQALYGGWMRISPKVKQALYGADRANDITNFFRTAAEVARLENPSGTAAQMQTILRYGRAAAGVFSLGLWNPVREGVTELTQYALAHMLWSPATAKLLTKAMRIPQHAPNAVAVAAQLTNAARAAGVPVQIAKTAAAPPLAAQNNQPQATPVQVGPFTAREVH